MKRKRNPESVALARAMRKDGQKLSVIAAHFGVSVTAIRQWLDDKFYRKIKKANSRYNANNLEAGRKAAKKHYAKLSDADKEQRKVKQRKRYAESPAVMRRFNKLRAKYGDAAQARIEHQLRAAIMGHAGRLRSVHLKLMEACTGMSRVEFTKHMDKVEPIPPFRGVREWTDPMIVAASIAETSVSLKEVLGYGVTQSAIFAARAFISRQLAAQAREAR